jgi:hypothetical protein
MLFLPGSYKDNKERINAKREKEGKKGIREESKTGKRDSRILFSPHRFERLASYVDVMNVRSTKSCRSSYRVLGKSMDIFI